MPRRPRRELEGEIFHVLNRSVGRARIFRADADYAAFEEALAQAQEKWPIRLLSYCVMPNHWHLVLWPRGGELSAVLHWLTMTHAQRWHAYYGTTGTGPLYQGRFKAFPVANDAHLWTVCRYVERNPVRAGLVPRAEGWRWSSVRRHHSPDREAPPALAPWPIEVPRNWIDRVNRAEMAGELAQLRSAVRENAPFGGAAWRDAIAQRTGVPERRPPRGGPAGRRLPSPHPQGKPAGAREESR